MSARSSILAAFPALCVGLFLGYLLAARLAAPAQASARDARSLRPGATLAVDAAGAERAAARPELATAPALAAVARDDARAAADAQPLERVARLTDGELERALAAVDAPAIAPRVAGAGAIDGLVFDDAGAPVAGVIVVAQLVAEEASDPRDVGAGPPDEQSLEDALRERARLWADARATRRRARTAADGRFAVEGLQEGGAYHVRAYLEGFVLTAETPAYLISPGASVSFRARRVQAVRIELVLPDGSTPDAGVITVRRGDDATDYAWSRAEPELRLEPGYVTLRGFADVRTSGRLGVDSAFASEETRLDASRRAEGPLVLALKPRSGIRGRVLQPIGASGEHRTARLLALPSGGAFEDEALARSDRYSEIRGDRYRFLDLAPGLYAVGLSDWNGRLFASATAKIEQGVVDVDLVVPEADPERVLVVRVNDPAGRPVDAVHLQWNVRTAEGTQRSEQVLPHRRGSDGAFHVLADPELATAGPDVVFELTATHSVFGARSVAVPRGAREVAITFAEPVALVVAVQRYVGSAYEGRIEVSAQLDDGASDDHVRWWAPHGEVDGALDAEGVARFDPLAPGRYEVTLLAKVGPWERRALRSVEVEVETGETRVDVALPDLHVLTVEAPGLPPKSRLHLASANERGFYGGTVQLDEDRRATFEMLPAGEYVLRGSFAEVTVVVPCGTFLLDARQPNCLRVAISDSEGALAKAGLQPGDRIVGADGRDFEEASKGWDALRGEGETRLAVLRDGARIEVVMPRTTRNLTPAYLGGALYPEGRK